MKSRNLVIAIAVALAAYLLIVHQKSGAADVEMKGEYFSNPYIVLLSSSKLSAVLEHPEIKVLAGRSYIVGKVPALNEHWKLVAGNPEWVPAETIAEMIEFKTLDEIQAYMALQKTQSQADSQN